MGVFEQVLSGVQQAMQAPPAGVSSPQDIAPPPKPDVPGFQDALGGVKAEASGQLPPVTMTEDHVMASMLQKRQQMQEAHQTITDNSATRLLSAFGQGITDVGVSLLTPPALPPEAEIDKSVPISGEDSWLQSMGKEVVRESIRTGYYASDIANKVMTAFTGIPLAGTQETLRQLGEETGSDMPEAMAEGMNDPAMMMLLHQIAPITPEKPLRKGAPEWHEEMNAAIRSLSPDAIHALVASPPLPAEVIRAVDNGIIRPSDDQIKNDAMQVANARAARMQMQRDLVDTSRGEGVQDIARRLHPDLFEEKDRLDARQQALRENIDNAEKVYGKEYDEKAAPLQEFHEQVEDIPGKERRQARAALRDLGSREDYIRDAEQRDREEVQENEHRLWDLAPDTFAANQRAAGLLGAKVETVAPEAHEAPAAQPAQEIPAILFPEQGKPVEAPNTAAQQHNEEAATVAQSVASRLVEAGRPPEEAQAQGAIVGSHYDTLSKIYPEKGTAKEIYEREKPRLLTGKTGRIGKREAALSSGEFGSFRPAVEGASAIIKLAHTADATTFMHEEMHHFFDIMQRYAAEEGAPQRLKDDYETARKWMGLPKDADIYGRTDKGKYVHEKPLEKIARGFETYLREGRAPSKELAGVFAKFKTWITDIYKALKKSGQPISDDIRGVFDRMLAEKPERTIISPEEPGRLLAAIHEADEKTIPPAHAAEARDTMRGEIDKTAKLHEPEVHDELKTAGSKARTESIAGEAGSVGTTGKEEKPAGEGGAAASPATVGAGGSAVKPKGGSARGVFRPVPRKPLTLLDWVRKNGGVKDEGGTLLAALGKDAPIRKNGISLDDMALKAHEAGYFDEKGGERPTMNDLIDKLIQDGQTKDQYSTKDQAAWDKYNDAVQRNSEADRIAHELGIETAGKTHAQFWNEVREKMSVDEQAHGALSKEEEAQKQFDEQQQKAKEYLESHEHETWVKPKSDTRNLQEMENEYKQETASRKPLAGETASGEPGIAAGNQGRTETVDGQGGDSPGTRPKPSEGANAGGDERPKSKSVDQLFDKQGNLIPKNLTDSEETIAGLKKMASETPSLNHDVTPDVKVAEVALSMGVREQELNLQKMREVFVKNDIPWAAGMRSLTVMMDRVMDETTKLAEKTKNGTIQDDINFMESWEQFKMIGETLSGTAQEAGLLLRSFRGSMKATLETVGSLDDLFQTRMSMSRDDVKKLAATLTDKLNNRDRAKLMKESQKPGVGENISSFLRFNVVSGFLTHLKWITGTAVNTLAVKPMLIDTYAGLENRAGMMFGKSDTGARLTGGFRGLWYALSKRLPTILSNTGASAASGKTLMMPFEDTKGALMGTGMQKALNVPAEWLKSEVDKAFKPDMFPDLVDLENRIKSSKTGMESKLALGEKYRALLDQKRDIIARQLAANWQARDKSWKEVYGEMGNFATSMGAAIKNTVNKIATYSPKDQPLIERRYGNLNERVPNIYVKGVPILPFGSISEGIARPVTATTHSLIREFGAAIESKQVATEIAAKEGYKDEALAQRAAWLMNNATPEMWKKLTERANEQTFMQHDGAMAKALVNMRRGFDEFGRKTIKAPLGTMVMPVAEIPANVLGTKIKQYTPFGLIMNDQRALAKSWSREGQIARGKLMVGTVGALSLGWWLYGRGDVTPSRPTTEAEENVRKNSIGPSNSVRVGDYWINLDHVPIIGDMLTMGANLHHFKDIAMSEDESEKTASAAEDAVKGFFTHDLGLNQLSDLMSAIDGRKSMPKYLEGLAGETVPQYISQGASLLDPYKRDKKDFIANMQSRVPGSSLSLAPMIDSVTGEPVEQHAMGIQKAKDDPVAMEWYKLGLHPANPKPVINDVPLDPTQSAEYSSIRGHILYNGMQDLTLGAGKDDYGALDRNGKLKAVHSREQHASNCAKSIMFNKYPELLKDANDKYEAQCRDEIQ